MGVFQSMRLCVFFRSDVEAEVEGHPWSEPQSYGFLNTWAQLPHEFFVACDVS